MNELLPAAIGAQMALTQQKVALSMLKKSAESQQQIANMVLEGAQNAAAAGRGQLVNIAA